LRVTSGGLIQVDVDGGGDHWITLSAINGSAAVALRYLSGGAATTVSVARTSDASTPHATHVESAALDVTDVYQHHAPIDVI